MDKSKQAFEIMRVHRMNCAQAVLTVFCEDLGLTPITALKVAMGFGGGMARTGKTCGAVTGAYMVLGLSQKISPENPYKSIDKTYELVHKFNREFEAIHGSLTCKELLGYDLNTPHGLAEARTKKVFTSLCPHFVADSVKILSDILKSDQTPVE
jgi:C_GCAxxG_C_C family probable redox protein